MDDSETDGLESQSLNTIVLLPSLLHRNDREWSMECVGFCARIAKRIATLTSPRHRTRVHTSVSHAVGRGGEDAACVEGVVFGDAAEGMKVER
jgi:hypothetical protein